ncbi:MAG: hypothetical protein M1821_007140 [Bathelium mastoideum]|nr:MAG: hypothetical protein M1821_007140 [Bathelium mastoideum]KAI9694650.1 MAG: hypothetical protein M1822_000266 [Bathelium mastoideum]
MAPTRSKKQKSSDSSGYEAGSENAALQTADISHEQFRATTPTRSPSKQPVTITQAQKQALIDNLQLEITERARKLRAQYALQAQGLRSRLEMRINRIPQALRKANLGELLLKQAERENAPKHDSPEIPAKIISAETMRSPPPPPPPPPMPKNDINKDATKIRGTKRKSDQMASDDKENDIGGLAMPKKRSKASGSTAAPARATRTASRKVNPSQVLSPKSNNSRTIPHSPMRPPPLPAAKSYLAKPVSPYKMAPSIEAATASLAGMVNEKSKAPRAASRQAKNTAPAAATAGVGRGKKATAKAPPAGAGHVRSSDGSNTSDASAGTTIITKSKVEKKPPAKKAAGARMVGGAAALKKATAAVQTKNVTTGAVPAEGRRVLRKR